MGFGDKNKPNIDKRSCSGSVRKRVIVFRCVLVLGYADLSHRVTASRETEPRTETSGTSQVSAAAGHCTPAAVRIRRVQEFLNFEIATVRC